MIDEMVEAEGYIVSKIDLIAILIVMYARYISL